MKIGIGPTYYDADRLQKMREHGYDCIDFSLADTDAPIYKVDGADFVKMALAIKEKINAAGIDINQVHGPWRWPVQDSTQEDREERFDKMSKSIHAARLLGAEYLVIHPIMPFGVDAAPEPFWQMNLNFLTRLAKVGEEHGVVVCLENMPFPALPTSSPEQTLKMVKQVNSPYLRVCLDTGHSVILGVSPADAVRQLGREYLAVLHVHDNDGKHDNHWVPGRGVIDWKAFSAALWEIGFNGSVSLETSAYSERGHVADEIFKDAANTEELERHLAETAYKIAHFNGNNN